jgi:hypothetical protein
MPVIQKPALRDLYNRLSAQPASKVDNAALDKIVGIVGDANDAQLSGLTREQKLAVAQKGLDAQEKADITTLLGDASFASKLEPAAANFLKAIVGLEALQGVDTLSTSASTGATGATGAGTVEQQASAKLRELIKNGELSKWYDAMIGATNNPALKAEAEALFAKLPVVKPGMTGADFVKAGLWTVAPRGIEEMQKSARYLPGRQVLVETTLYAKIPAPRDPSYERERRKIGTFDAAGPTAVTYRATLVGEDPANAQNFLVKVDGNDKPVSVTKASVIAQNQPFVLSDQHVKSDVKRDLPFGVWGTWNVDFSTPLAKAKLCEIAIGMDQFVKQLDFSKQKTTPSGGAIGAVFGRGETAKKMVELQKACVETVFNAIDMKYPRDDHRPFNDPGRVHNDVRDAARQAVRGTGMCVQQSTVFGALLTPFMDVLGVDAQFRLGNCFRNINHATDNVYSKDFMSPHGWWQLTFRPSMEMTVTDRTWDQVNLTLDLAYGFPYGDRYANRNIEGFSPQKLADSDVNVSGDVSVQTFERQFSQVGHGRENHISRHNRD